jgi:glycosyltransferase involved in cell wall biosynthesis
MTKVSVLVPIHGDAPFLNETLVSIKNQSFKDFDCILVFDRASQAVRDLAIKYCKDDSTFITLDSVGSGISNALNTGLKMSTSEYIARIDADDLMDVDRLETQLSYLEHNQKKILLGTQIRFINEEGQYLRESRYETDSKKLIKLLKIRNQIAHPSSMYRRENIINSGGYDSTFNGCEDYHLWLRLSSRENVANLKKTLVSYRQHEMQVTNRNREESLFLESLARIDSESPLNPQTKKQIVEKSKDSEALKSIRRRILIQLSIRDPNRFRKLLSRDYLNRVLKYDVNRNSFGLFFLRSWCLLLAYLLSPHQTQIFAISVLKEFKRRNYADS